MALTESNMLEIGTQAPDFTLYDVVSAKEVSLQDVRGSKGTLIYFICNHCPYVLYVIEELIAIAEQYREKGIQTLAISSNDIERYPTDSPDNMEAFAKRQGFTFPYLYDESQAVARAYDAACTPDLYLFDQDNSLYYRGRLDDVRPSSGKAVTGEDLRSALDSLIAGKKAPANQYPSMGCGIKWIEK